MLQLLTLYSLHSPRYRLPEPNANGDYEILIL